MKRMLLLLVCTTGALHLAEAQVFPPGYDVARYAQESVQISANAERGVADFYRGDFLQAQRFLLEGAARNKPISMFFLGWIEFLSEQWDASIAWFDKAARLERQSTYFQYFLARAKGMRIKSLNPLQAVGEIGSFRETLFAALEKDQNFLLLLESAIDYYIQAPSFVGGSFEQANKLVQKARGLSPVYGQLLEALVYLAGGDDKRAEQSFQVAISDRPNWSRPYEEYAVFLANRKRYAEAWAVVDAARAYVRDSVAVNFTIGKIALLSASHLTEGVAALDAYRKAAWTAEMPTHAEAWVLMAKLYALQKRKSDASDAIRRALELQPDYTSALEYQRELQ